jgi:hypothetical protein
MEPAALVFLNSDIARRLAVAWPLLPAGQRKSFKAWAEYAGVEDYQAERHGKPLRESGVCADNGATDPLALQFIAAKMTSGIKVKK